MQRFINFLMGVLRSRFGISSGNQGQTAGPDQWARPTQSGSSSRTNCDKDHYRNGSGHQEVTRYTVHEVSEGDLLPGDINTEERIGNRMRFTKDHALVRGPSGRIGKPTDVTMRCADCGSYDLEQEPVSCSHCGLLLCSPCRRLLNQPSQGELSLCRAAYESYVENWDCWLEEEDSANWSSSLPPREIPVDCPAFRNRGSR